MPTPGDPPLDLVCGDLLAELVSIVFVVIYVVYKVVLIEDHPRELLTGHLSEVADDKVTPLDPELDVFISACLHLVVTLDKLLLGWTRLLGLSPGTGTGSEGARGGLLLSEAGEESGGEEVGHEEDGRGEDGSTKDPRRPPPESVGNGEEEGEECEEGDDRGDGEANPRGMKHSMGIAFGR